jgi:DNA-directed RNA polymerase subunit RPC12/RpoP
VKRRRRAKPKPKPRIRNIWYWKCTDIGSNKLGIECPHCGGKTVVNKKDWVTKFRDFTTRGCPYCEWFATIPLDLLPARDPRREDYSV